MQILICYSVIIICKTGMLFSYHHLQGQENRTLMRNTGKHRCQLPHRSVCVGGQWLIWLWLLDIDDTEVDSRSTVNHSGHSSVTEIKKCVNVDDLDTAWNPARIEYKCHSACKSD